MLPVDNADHVWVTSARPVIEQAFNVFLSSGEWPKVTELRRHFARLGQNVDIAQIVKDKPRPPGYQEPWVEETLKLSIRHLRYLPQAHQLVWVCVVATRRSVEVYLSDEDELKIQSSDPHIALQAGGDTSLLVRAGAVLQDEVAGPTAGSGSGPDHWELWINEHNILDYRTVSSPDDFVASQDAILQRSIAQLPNVAAAAPLPIVVFVIMPFVPTWSTPVYGMIKRAIDSLGVVPSPIVSRADDITNPGRITDQIVESIGTADVVVADLTGLNPNVMWELGFAHASGKLVVMLNQEVATSPFDLRDYRQVIYSHPSTLAHEVTLATHMRSAISLASSRTARPQP